MVIYARLGPATDSYRRILAGTRGLPRQATPNRLRDHSQPALIFAARYQPAVLFAPKLALHLQVNYAHPDVQCSAHLVPAPSSKADVFPDPPPITASHSAQASNSPR